MVKAVVDQEIKAIFGETTPDLYFKTHLPPSTNIADTMRNHKLECLYSGKGDHLAFLR